MTGPSSPIVGRAIIKALDRDQEEAAEALEDGERQAALDEADLRELEHSQYAAVAPVPPTRAQPARRRSLLDRLLRR